MIQDEKLLKLQGWLLNEKQKAEDLIREGLNYEMEIKHRGRVISMLETIIEIKNILNEASVAQEKVCVNHGKEDYIYEDGSIYCRYCNQPV